MSTDKKEFIPGIASPDELRVLKSIEWQPAKTYPATPQSIRSLIRAIDQITGDDICMAILHNCKLALMSWPTPEDNHLSTSDTPSKSLRDEFAIHAPLTIADAERSLSDENTGFVNWGHIMKRLSQMQFAYADVMLKARKGVSDAA